MTRDQIKALIENAPICRFIRSKGIYDEYVEELFKYARTGAPIRTERLSCDNAINVFAWSRTVSGATYWIDLNNEFCETFDEWDISLFESRLNYKYY